MKTKEALLEVSQKYFNDYPKEEAFHATSDGNFFLEKNKSIAKSHANSNKLELHTITREQAAETKTKTKTAVIIPHGDPSKAWTKDQLIEFGKKNFPDLKLTKNMKEDSILSKLAEVKGSTEPNPNEGGSQAPADQGSDEPNAGEGGSQAPADQGADDSNADDLESLRKKYKELAGKNVYNGWNEEQLKDKIAELEKPAGS